MYHETVLFFVSVVAQEYLKFEKQSGSENDAVLCNGFVHDFFLVAYILKALGLFLCKKPYTLGNYNKMQSAQI